MINIFEVNETNKMIEKENLDVRTITLGISLLDCIDADLDALNRERSTVQDHPCRAEPGEDGRGRFPRNTGSRS